MKTARQRFWEKVDRSWGNGPWGDCWEWTASLNNKGYGRFRGLGIEMYAHRFAWFLRYGKLPEPFALHRCDNRKCVRWSHLFEGDSKANMLDCSAKGRLNTWSSRKTHCKQGHPYDESNIYWEKNRRGGPANKWRSCKQCQLAKQRRRRAAKRVFQLTINPLSEAHQ